MLNNHKWDNYLKLPAIVKAKEKILSLTKELEFYEDTHTYIYNGVRLESVSGVVDKWANVNEKEMLDICASRAKAFPNYKYYGMSRDEIKAVWDEKGRKACEFGTKCHSFGEDMFYYMTGQLNKEPIPTCKHEEAIVKFWNDLPVCLVPVLAETRVMDIDSLPYAGTFDILFYYYNMDNPNRSGFVIFDYKTNENLYSEYNRSHHRMMRQPFDSLPEESLGHYTLQLSLYQIPLQKLGLPIVARTLIWLQPDATYKKIVTSDKTDKLLKVMRNMNCLTFREASCMASVFCPCNDNCETLKKKKEYESKD